MTTKQIKTLTSLFTIFIAATMTAACDIDAKDIAEDIEDQLSIDDDLDLDLDDDDDDDDRDDDDNHNEGVPAVEGEWYGTLTIEEEVFDMYFDLDQDGDFAAGIGGYQSYFFDAEDNWYAGVYLFEVDVDITSHSGTHTLDFEPSNCMAEIDGEYYEMACDAPFTLSMTESSSIRGNLNEGQVVLSQ